MKKLTLWVSDETMAVSITTIEDVREKEDLYTTQISSQVFTDVEDGDVLDME